MNSESFAIRTPSESPVARSPRHPAGRLGAPRGPIGSTTAPPHLYPARLLAHPRGCPADWSAIVPATSGSTTPVWQRRYEPTRSLPNFSPHPVPWPTGGAEG
ncbi:nitric oxide synthase oxygenase [Streptomyces sp. RLB1-33]